MEILLIILVIGLMFGLYIAPKNVLQTIIMLVFILAGLYCLAIGKYFAMLILLVTGISISYFIEKDSVKHGIVGVLVIFLILQLVGLGYNNNITENKTVVQENVKHSKIDTKLNSQMMSLFRAPQENNLNKVIERLKTITKTINDEDLSYADIDATYDEFKIKIGNHIMELTAASSNFVENQSMGLPKKSDVLKSALISMIILKSKRAEDHNIFHFRKNNWYNFFSEKNGIYFGDELAISEEDLAKHFPFLLWRVNEYITFLNNTNSSE